MPFAKQVLVFGNYNEKNIISIFFYGACHSGKLSGFFC